MAREYGRVLLSIWSDPDFVRLGSRTQRLYMLLVSQPGMATCGVQSYAPRRWAGLAPDTTARQIETGISDLEVVKFVVVDRDTDELLIRSHLRHDRALATTNVAKSLARTWRQIASPQLKQIVLAELQRLHVETQYEDKPWPGWDIPEIRAMLAAPVLHPAPRPTSERTLA